jgi:hypothetical protein
MTDRRDFDRNLDMDPRLDMGAGMPTGTANAWEWIWIAGAAFILVVLALIFSSGMST